MRLLLSILSVGLLLVLLAAGNAMAQEERVVFKKKTIIDLTGATIDGEITKPEGSYIVNRKLSRFSTLIQARGDFIPELLTSHNDI